MLAWLHEWNTLLIDRNKTSYCLTSMVMLVLSFFHNFFKVYEHYCLSKSLHVCRESSLFLKSVLELWKVFLHKLCDARIRVCEENEVQWRLLPALPVRGQWFWVPQKLKLITYWNWLNLYVFTTFIIIFEDYFSAFNNHKIWWFMDTCRDTRQGMRKRVFSDSS